MHSHKPYFKNQKKSKLSDQREKLSICMQPTPGYLLITLLLLDGQNINYRIIFYVKRGRNLSFYFSPFFISSLKLPINLIERLIDFF